MWKDIPDYESQYEINDYGVVRGKLRKTRCGNGYRSVPAKVLSISTCKEFDYDCVILTKDGKTKQFLVHRLVAITFIPNPDNLPIVNHKDGNKKNNHVDNLEWCDRIYNGIHASRSGLLGNSTYKPVRCVETGKVFNSQTAAARKYKMDPASVTTSARTGKSTKGYHFEYVCNYTDISFYDYPDSKDPIETSIRYGQLTRCIELDRTYPSVEAAGRSLNIPSHRIRHAIELHDGLEPFSGYHFEVLNKELDYS